MLLPAGVQPAWQWDWLTSCCPDWFFCVTAGPALSYRTRLLWRQPHARSLAIRTPSPCGLKWDSRTGAARTSAAGQQTHSRVQLTSCTNHPPTSSSTQDPTHVQVCGWHICRPRLLVYGPAACAAMCATPFLLAAAIAAALLPS